MAINCEGVFLVALLAWAAACPPTLNSGTYRINYEFPPNCKKTACDYSVAISTNGGNPNFLDFMVEGNARGWIAIGFSTKGNMPDADVLVCALNPSNNNVEIIDTYNDGYTNIRDTKQDVCPHHSSYNNGRISCSFSRAIDTEDNQDKKLTEPYYLLYGISNKPNAVSSATINLSYHDVTPRTSTDTHNPAKDTAKENVHVEHTSEGTTSPNLPTSHTPADAALTGPSSDQTNIPFPLNGNHTMNHAYEVEDVPSASPSTNYPIEKQATPNTINSIAIYMSEDTTNHATKVEPNGPTTHSPVIDLKSEENTTSTSISSITNQTSKGENITSANTTFNIGHISTTAGPVINHQFEEVTHSNSMTSHTSKEPTLSTPTSLIVDPATKTENSFPSTNSEVINNTSMTNSITEVFISLEPNTDAAITSSMTDPTPGVLNTVTQMPEEEHATTISPVIDHSSAKEPILTSSEPTPATTITNANLNSLNSENHKTSTAFLPTTSYPYTEQTDSDNDILNANPSSKPPYTISNSASPPANHISTPEPISEIGISSESPGSPTDEVISTLPSTSVTILEYLPSIPPKVDIFPGTNNPSGKTTINVYSPTGCPPSISSNTNQFIKTIPSDCNRTSCDYYISIQTNTENPRYLDFILEASAQGWAAIGFSSTPGMRDSDVLACALHPDTKSVVILDTYNVARRYENVHDSVQNVCPHSAAFSDGRISCTFSRAISTGDEQDKDLSKDSYQLYAAVDDSPIIQDQVVRLSYHSHQVPIVSDDTVNIASEIATLSAKTSNNEFITPLSSATPTISSGYVATCPPEPPANTKYRFQITIAPNCAEPKGCGNFMLGIRTNDQDARYLDFALEGDAEGWIAVGFSTKRGMPDADVLACALNPSSNNVEIIDTYNDDYTNIRDTKQDVCPHHSSYNNGRISCSFSRAIDTEDNQDKKLNEPYYLLYGAVDAKPNTVKPNTLLQLKYHGGQVPLMTNNRINPTFHQETVNTTASHIDTKHLLVLSHGILMLVAWPMLATVAIFFASWMKPALPKGGWFQVHRGMMAASLITAMCAFTLIFVANRESICPGLISFSSRESVAHFALGILVMGLHILNPLISVARCAPDAPRRWIFNLIHGSLIGVGAYLLALINTGIGIFLIEKDHHHILWIYLAYIGFVFILLLVLFVVFTVIAAKSKDASKLGPPLLKPLFNRIKPSLQNKSSAVMIDMAAVPPQNPEAPTQQNAEPKKEKLASEDAPLRWTGLVTLLAVMLPMGAVIGIKIALN